MFGRRSRLRLGARIALAWAGLLLMIASFAWWQGTSKPGPPIATTPRAPAKAQPFPVVVLDPGHGGQDSGAMFAGVLEKDLTLDIAQRVDRLLQAEGLATIMTRVGDAYVSLADRAALANRTPNCVLVSIHFNEDSKRASTGIETYYAEHPIPMGEPLLSWLPFLQKAAAAVEGPDIESQSMAGFIQEALVARTQAVNRGTKSKQYFVIANVRHPAVLVEGGFLTNKEDIARLTSSDYRDQIAAAISEGVIRYRDLKQHQLALAAPTPAPGGHE
ncbi:MAG TPA: N-acetylmuramoyl-L-alanine amidase [Chthoniobacterales bacterium]|jgi:N-acetylmuramoyl-L-alanine amidase